MRVVISESRLLAALHEVALIEDLFATGHSFVVADIFLAQQELGSHLESSLMNLGLVVEGLSSDDMRSMAEIRRSHPGLCTGNVASLTLSLARAYPLLVGNHGLATVPAASTYGIFDICWVMDELEAAVPSNRMLECFQAVIANDRGNLHSPGVASRLQRYASMNNVNAL